MATGITDEEVYANLRSEVLEDLREKIVEKLEPYKLYSYLRQNKIMDAEDCERIKAQITRRQKAEVFLDILDTKGPEGFDHFCEGIRKRCTGQLHLLRMILTEFDKRRSEIEPGNLQQSLSCTACPLDPKLSVQLPVDVGVPQLEVGGADNLPAPGDIGPGVPSPPDEMSPGDHSFPPPYADDPPPYTA